MGFLLGFCLLFSSCSKQEEKPTTYLRFAVQKDPSSFDPRKGSDITTSTLHFLLFEGLTRLSKEAKAELALASSVEIQDRGKKYVFHLKKTLWSDGKPLTAFDFERCWKEALNPDFPISNVHLFYPIKNAALVKKGKVPIEEVGIHALDANTFIVELEEPTPYFLEMISFSCFHPVKIGKDANDAIGNGPYVLTKWCFHNYLIFKKNPLYWDKESVQANIRVSIIEDESTAFGLFEKNQLDFIGGPLLPLPIDALKNLDEKKLKNTAIAGSTVCFFNTKAFPFHNENMRKAFAYAVCRQEIANCIGNGKNSFALSLLPPILSPQRVDFPEGNKKIARAYFAKALQELNIQKKDLALTYIFSKREQHHLVAQILQQQWKEVLNVDVELQMLENKALLEKLSSSNFCFGQSIWMAQYSDPMAILERFSQASLPKNYSRWEEEEFHTLLKESATAFSPQKREEMLHQAEKLLLEKMPLFPLYHWSYSFLVSPRIKNMEISCLGSIDFAHVALNEKDSL